MFRKNEPLKSVLLYVYTEAGSKSIITHTHTYQVGLPQTKRDDDRYYTGVLKVLCVILLHSHSLSFFTPLTIKKPVFFVHSRVMSV